MYYNSKELEKLGGLFAIHNRSVHSTTNFSSFEIVYGFNPLTPLDLLPLLVNEMTSLDGEKTAEMVKKLHKSVRKYIEKKMSNMRPKPTRAVEKSSLNRVIGFGCI